MKKLVPYGLILMILACSKENAWDCIQNEGTIVQVNIEVNDFERIRVNRDVQLIVKEGPEYDVTLQSGENLINDIRIEVVGDRLEITDNNSCNFVRPYNLTKVFVTAPNLTEIRNASQYEITSDGILNYPDLVLTAEDFNEADSFNVGDIRLELNSSSVQIISNGLSSYYLSGTVTDLNVGFFAGDGRFEGAQLIADHVLVFHRGSNDMLVNPQLSLSGELRSTGNVISFNQPAQVNVEAFYTGQLIFQD